MKLDWSLSEANRRESLAIFVFQVIMQREIRSFPDLK